MSRFHGLEVGWWLALSLLLGFAAGSAVWRLTGAGTDAPPVPDSRSRGEQAGVVLEGSAGEVREILLRHDPIERTALLAARLERLPPESLDAVLAAYDSVFLDLGDVELVLLAEWWARFDPEGAFEWSQGDWRARDLAVVCAVARVWARSDPEAVLAHALKLPNNARWAVVDAAVRGWDESGRPGVLEYAERLNDVEQRNRASFVVARRRVLRDGPAAAFQWAEDLPLEPESRTELLLRVATAAVETDPEAAATWAAAHIDEVGPRVAERVARRWAHRDAGAALGWVATLPPGEARDEALREGFRIWLGRDREGARAWLRETALEPAHDPVISLAAKSYALDQPQEGVAWASKIHDEELRWGTLTLLAWYWVAQDETAARAWIERERPGAPEVYQRKLLEDPPPQVRRVVEQRRRRLGASSEAQGG